MVIGLKCIMLLFLVFFSVVFVVYGELVVLKICIVIIYFFGGLFVFVFYYRILMSFGFFF